MRIFKGLFVLLFAVTVFSCLPDQEVRIYSISYFFVDSTSGWTHGFANYPLDSSGYHLNFKHELLPYKINPDSTRKSLRISGINHNDGLFMFVKKKVTGLRKNTTYQILLNVRFASNAPTGEVDGESPGESVYVKMGASIFEPDTELINGYYRLNLDKGELAESGEDMIVIGNVGIAATTTLYTLATRSNSSNNSVFATTNDQGELWLIVGTDSDYEGETKLYYTQVDALFNQAN